MNQTVFALKSWQSSEDDGKGKSTQITVWHVLLQGRGKLMLGARGRAPNSLWATSSGIQRRVDIAIGCEEWKRISQSEMWVDFQTGVSWGNIMVAAICWTPTTCQALSKWFLIWRLWFLFPCYWPISWVLEKIYHSSKVMQLKVDKIRFESRYVWLALSVHISKKHYCLSVCRNAKFPSSWKL